MTIGEGGTRREEIRWAERGYKRGVAVVEVAVVAGYIAAETY